MPPLRPDPLAVRDQLPLFPSDPRAPTGAVQSYRGLRSPYVRQIIRLLAYLKAATGTQIIEEIFVSRGTPRRYGARLLKAMVDQGLVRAQAVSPARGRASPWAYQVTEAGLVWAGITVAPRLLARLSGPQLRSRLQFTEVLLTRIAEGWRPVPPSRGAFKFLKRWALQPYAGRVLGFGDKSRKKALEDVPDDSAMSHWVLVRQSDGPDALEVRVLFLATEATKLRREIRRLPVLLGFPAIVFELVCDAPARLAPTELALKKHGKRKKFTFTTVVLPPFASRVVDREASPAEIRRRARPPVGWEPWYNSPPDKTAPTPGAAATPKTPTERRATVRKPRPSGSAPDSSTMPRPTAAPPNRPGRGKAVAQPATMPLFQPALVNSARTESPTPANPETPVEEIATTPVVDTVESGARRPPSAAIDQDDDSREEQKPVGDPEASGLIPAPIPPPDTLKMADVPMANESTSVPVPAVIPPHSDEQTTESWPELPREVAGDSALPSPVPALPLETPRFDIFAEEDDLTLD